MVSEPDVDDTEAAWNYLSSGVRYQFTDNYVAITANKHIGSYEFAYFTPAEFDELIDNFDTVSGRFYNLRIERLNSGGIDIKHRDVGHIVHVGKDQLQDIADDWDREQSFVEYLNEQDYIWDLDEIDAFDDYVNVSFKMCASWSQVRGIREDDNVQMRYVDVENGRVRMEITDERSHGLTLEDVNVYPFATELTSDKEGPAREANGKFGKYTSDGKTRLVVEADSEADEILSSRFGGNDGTFYEDENPLDCLE